MRRTRPSGKIVLGGGLHVRRPHGFETPSKFWLIPCTLPQIFGSNHPPLPLFFSRPAVMDVRFVSSRLTSYLSILFFFNSPISCKGFTTSFSSRLPMTLFSSKPYAISCLSPIIASTHPPYGLAGNFSAEQRVLQKSSMYPSPR